MRDFASLVRAELARARFIFGTHSSLHEMYALILEELDEFWDEVKKKRDERDKAKLLNELVQVAAMCQAAAEDCGLITD